jgi:hypothetical protein
MNRANMIAVQLLQQLTNAATQAKKALAEGVPAQGNLPAVTAADIATALGTTNAAVVAAVITAAGV